MRLRQHSHRVATLHHLVWQERETSAETRGPDSGHRLTISRRNPAIDLCSLVECRRGRGSTAHLSLRQEGDHLAPSLGAQLADTEHHAWG
jgi:hypothetical protein